MKNYLLILILILSLNINLTNVKAAELEGSVITIGNNDTKKEKITRSDIFIFFSKYYKDQIPNSYKYINVNFKDINKGSILDDSIKRLIYLNLIENPKRVLAKNEQLNAWGFFRLAEKTLNIKINDAESEYRLKNRYTTQNDINVVSKFIGKNTLSINNYSARKDLKQKIAILGDVYKTLIEGHYNKDTLKKEDLIDSAIKGLTKGTNDIHTVYFPPVESESFTDSLSGEYEGIGAYVNMEVPGTVRILSPIPGSPSEKAGVKGGDLVIKIDGREIKEINGLKEVITWIKGPAGTDVILTINRKGKILDITVKREKIIINDIESKILNTTTQYIQIKSFGGNVSKNFKDTLKIMKENENINKIIIDLRNNGGGFLSEVAEILSYFVKKGQKTAIVEYHDNNKTFISRGYNLIDFSKYKIIILQNSGTASASEILIGTLKDYYPKIVLIGEKTYGKGSVQVMKSYIDGSLLKYTIAKWFTGLTKTGIDGIGIKPTIELEFDFANYKKNGFDNQLDKAIFIN